MFKITRRNFIKKLATAIGGIYASRLSTPYITQVSAQTKLTDIAVASGTEAQVNTYNAIKALGGIKKFVREGARVVIKPNIAWNRTPQQAGNTNPEVVAALAKMCLEAKAKHVSVWDHTCHNPKDTYERSGIQKAALEAGAKVHYVNSQDFMQIDIKRGKLLTNVEVYREILECDVFINVPVAKVHGLSTLTLGMKNLMGTIKDRPVMHDRIHEKLPELYSAIRPHLTVLDATRILIEHGPQGGNLKDVKMVNKIIAGTDLVGVDAYGATLFGFYPRDIGYIERAHDMKLGNVRLPHTRIIKC